MRVIQREGDGWGLGRSERKKDASIPQLTNYSPFLIEESHFNFMFYSIMVSAKNLSTAHCSMNVA